LEALNLNDLDHATVVRWDASGMSWVRVEALPLQTGTGILVRLPVTGVVALLKADAQPMVPPQPVIGGTLDGASATALPENTAVDILPNPSIIFMRPVQCLT